MCVRARAHTHTHVHTRVRTHTFFFFINFWCVVLAATYFKYRWYSGRLTSGSWPGQAVPSPFCQRSKDEGKLRPKFTKCEKINISEHAAGFRPPVAMAKPKWRQILLNLTLFSNVTSKEGKPMSCACSVFIPAKRMGVCNFHLWDKENHPSSCNGGIFRVFRAGGFDEINRR